MHVNDLLKLAVEKGASDLHLKVGSYPMCRIHGHLAPVTDEKQLDHEDLVEMAASIMSTAQRQKFKDAQEVDLAYSVGRSRPLPLQRVPAARHHRHRPPRHSGQGDEPRRSSACRRSSSKIAHEERGLVLVTGTTGSGKSTSLAAMIDHINANRTAHVITIEDPIEYLHRDIKCIINQREIGVDTRSFAYALRSALRQDPDVILVGEMRDMETIETAMHAAETGHLVFSTLHTLDATETINRIISVFPPHQQKQIRLQLASVLKAAIAQRLIPRKDGTGRCPGVEVLIATPFVKDCIVDKDKTHLIAGAIAQGTSQYGMQTFDQSIFSLFQRELISYEEALRWATNVDEFKLKVQGISTTADVSRDQMANTIFSKQPAGKPGTPGGRRRGPERQAQPRRPSPPQQSRLQGRRSRRISRASDPDGPGFQGFQSSEASFWIRFRNRNRGEQPLELWNLGRLEPPDAYTVALTLLSARELSEAQLRTRLKKRKFDEEDIDAAVSRLMSDRTLNDRRVAGAIARMESIDQTSWSSTRPPENPASRHR